MRRRCKEFASVSEIPRRRGFAVIVPRGLFADVGPAVWWHYSEARAEERAARAREMTAGVRVERLTETEGGN